MLLRASLARDDGGCLDFDERGVFDQDFHFDDGHGRIILAHLFAPDGADLGDGLERARDVAGVDDRDEGGVLGDRGGDVGGAVLVGEYLYGSSGNALVCVEFKTGQVKWSERSVAPGAVCYADGRLYLHGESGEVALVEAIPEAYRELGRFTPPNPPQKRANAGEKAWAYPVIADGRLYIRDADCLWSYDIKAAVTEK